MRIDTDVRMQRLLEPFAAADILVRGYAKDGVRITVADPATNDRVLAVLSNRSAILGE